MATVTLASELARQAFARAAGGPLIPGNRVRLLKDAQENYPAWLEAIAKARHRVHFESYIIHDDDVGRQFAAALCERARHGVRVRVLYDWWGCFNTAGRSYWQSLRAAGVEVRAYNPPRLGGPLRLLSRDHRKMVCVDSEVGFVSGLCVGQMWLGDPSRGLEPWRDTGIELRGPAVAELEAAFAELWGGEGAPLEGDPPVTLAPRGDAAVHVVASVPSTAGLLPVNELAATLASERLWLTDAYFVGTTGYMRALCEAARAGVDVRLLLPGASDVPVVKPLSRAGYRTLLTAGVRVFEWNGAMLHAKTAVLDGKLARVGSTNLNPASWFGNCELDVVVDDVDFSRQLEAQYVRDLERSTEIVLAEGEVKDRQPAARPHASGRSASAGALRLGNTLGAVVTRRRVLEPVEGRLLLAVSAVLAALAGLAALFPRVSAGLAAIVLGWFALAVAWRGIAAMRTR